MYGVVSGASRKLISAAIIRNGNKSVSRTDDLYTTETFLPRTLVLLPISRRQNTDDVTIKNPVLINGHMTKNLVLRLYS